jgi:NADP-dependent 3-hydroxy acid dehydrogenase YdfG
VTALAGRSAVVTGASRGIGAATARALATAGASVVLIARSAAELDALAAELGDGATPIAADLTAAAGLGAAVEQARDTLGGSPDILVNNAGIFRVAPAGEMPASVFADTIELNLVAPFRVMRAFLAGMLARRSGHIVNLGSVADRNAFPGNAAYSASKFGLRGLHEVLRAELRGSGVRATLVSPGAVDTALWDVAEAESPPGRFTARKDMLRPEAVAAAVLYAVTQPADVNVEELRLRRT